MSIYREGQDFSQIRTKIAFLIMLAEAEWTFWGRRVCFWWCNIQHTFCVNEGRIVWWTCQRSLVQQRGRVRSSHAYFLCFVSLDSKKAACSQMFSLLIWILTDATCTCHACECSNQVKVGLFSQNLAGTAVAGWTTRRSQRKGRSLIWQFVPVVCDVCTKVTVFSRWNRMCEKSFSDELVL